MRAAQQLREQRLPLFERLAAQIPLVGTGGVGIRIVFMVIAASLRFRNSLKADRKVTDGILAKTKLAQLEDAIEALCQMNRSAV